MRAKSLFFIFIVLVCMLLTTVLFAQSTPEEMQVIIDNQGLSWKAEWTPYSNLSAEELQGLLGTSDTPSNFVHEPTIIPPPITPLPSSFDWRNKVGHNYVTGIRNQKKDYNGNLVNCGSCYAHATTAALESHMLIQMEKPDANLDLSEQMMVGNCSNQHPGDCANGGYISAATAFLANPGISEEWCDPYRGTSEGCANACPDWTSHRYYLTGSSMVAFSKDQIKNAIYTYGPVVADMSVTNDFAQYYGLYSGVYESPSCCIYGSCTSCLGDLPICSQDGCGSVTRSCVAYHSILIVGWQDDPSIASWGGGYFIGKNSWGESWGVNGFFKIAYSQMNNCIKFGRNAFVYTSSSTSQPVYSIEGQVNGYYGPNCCINASITVFNQENAVVQQTACSRKPGTSSYYRMLLPGGSYTLTATEPSPSEGYTFNQPTTTVNLAGSNLTGINFIAYGKYSISGNTTFNSTPLANVTIKITGTALPTNGYTTTSNYNGLYSMPFLLPGTYTITPTLNGYVFSAATVNISNASQTMDFSATQETYSVSGTITKCGNPDPSVQVKSIDANGGMTYAYTNISGNYTISGLINGTYTIKANKSLMTKFSPTSQSATINGHNITGINFQEVALCRICSQSYFDGLKTCDLRDEDDTCFRSNLDSYTACIINQTINSSSPLYGQLLLATTASRAKGQPVNEEHTFHVASEGDYYVNIVNGDGENSNTLVSSATIDISDIGQIIRPNEFNKNVALISKPVHLMEGEYVLTSNVRSQPGSYITIILSSFDLSSGGELP
ncbi:MAG TPA: C1 family peptidase [Acidobacteriota bacterium]|jgi:hypothetical protein|nr:C1 family peptidase [Acidobacteriota bacterium]HNT16936.1 C1 family peptidase [Acidobacteriota bacterium]HQO20318.1 C1 family peptidase [Acidobacteriota bacterium]HQQ46833.1 C1 family peptidase [Acidobacteriota bacterium]